MSQFLRLFTHSRKSQPNRSSHSKENCGKSVCLDGESDYKTVGWMAFGNAEECFFFHFFIIDFVENLCHASNGESGEALTY